MPAFLASGSRWASTETDCPDRAELIDAAERILAAGLWCTVEVCLDVPAQRWERRLVVFRRHGPGVFDAVAEWVRQFPQADVRLGGCSRIDLRIVDDAPTHLCYLAAAERLAS